MKAMTSANSATASVSAKPSSTLPNTFGAAAGLRNAPATKLPKMLPMPTPTPARAMVARPAPMSFAAAGSMGLVLLSFDGLFSVTHVDCIIQIDTGQDGENIGLQDGDADFEAGQRDDEGERSPAAEDAQHDHEAAEHLQHGMARRHVGEQSHG